MARWRHEVVRAQLSDVPRAAPLFAAYRQFYDQPYELEASSAFLARRLARDESVVLIATDDTGSAVGFTQVYPTFSSTRLAPIWLLNDLFVHEDARGSGAVDALLDTAATMAAEAGAIAIELATAHDNRRAQAVYARHCYELDQTFRHYEKTLS